MPPYDSYDRLFDPYSFAFKPPAFPKVSIDPNVFKTDEQIERELRNAVTLVSSREQVVQSRKRVLAEAQASLRTARDKRDALQREDKKRKATAKREKYKGTLLIEDANGSKYLVKDVDISTVTDAPAALGKVTFYAGSYLIVSTGCDERITGEWSNERGYFVATKITKVCG